MKQKAGRGGRAKELFRAVIELFKPPRKLRYTREGIWFTILSVVIGALAINTGINLLYLILSMMLSFIVVSGILSELSIRNVSLQVDPPDQVFAGEAFSIKITLSNSKRFVPSYSLLCSPGDGHPSFESESSAYFQRIPPGRSVERPLKCTFSRRGVHRLKRFKLSTRFPFNLFEKSAAIASPVEILVYPAVGNILSFPSGLSSRAPVGEGASRAPRHSGLEFIGLQEYRPGDNPARIHWRSSAKTSTLLVKEMAGQETESLAVILDNVSRYETEEGFETAVSYVATLALQWAESGRTLHLCWFDDELEIASTEGRANVGMLMEILSTVAHAGMKPQEIDLAASLPPANSVIGVGPAGSRLLDTLAKGDGSRSSFSPVEVGSEAFNGMFTLNPPPGSEPRHKARSREVTLREDPT